MELWQERCGYCFMFFGRKKRGEWEQSIGGSAEAVVEIGREKEEAEEEQEEEGKEWERFRMTSTFRGREGREERKNWKLMEGKR